MAAKKAGMATGVEVARISVKVSPDSKQFRRELQSDLDAIEKSLSVQVDVEPDTSGFRKKVKAETAGMKTKVKVEADVDRGFFSRVADKLSSIDGPGFGSGINPMGYATIFAGIAAVAGPLMALLTSSLLALPGLVAAVATPVGALMLGLEGLQRSAMRLEQPFIDLKAGMSAATERQFTPAFEQLGKLFPTLQSALPKVSQGMADIAQSLADTVTSSTGAAKIQNTIENIGSALSKAAPGVSDFTDGLLTLAETFSSKLPGVSDWLNNTGKDFLAWVDGLKADGTLDKAFGGLGDTLKVFLDALGGIAKEGLDIFKNPQGLDEFNDGLKSIGESLKSIVTLSNAINSIAGLFKNFLPTFDFASIWKDISAPFTSADAPWRGIWDDMKAGAAEAYASIIGTFTQMGSDIANVASTIGSAFAGAWNGIVSAAQSAWNGVTQAVQSAWEGIKSAVQAGIEAVISFVSGMGSRIIGAITSIDLSGAGRALMEGLLGGIKAGAEAVYNFVSGIAKKIASLKGPISYDKVVLIPNGEALMQGLGKGLENGFQPVLDQAKEMAGKIAAAFSSGADPTSLLNGFSKQDVSRMEKTLTLETKRLEAQAKALDYQSKLTGDTSLKARAAEIRQMKEQLSLQEEMLSYADDYSDSISSSGGDPLVKAASGLLSAPANFASATGKQFLSDIGISGNGLISKAIGEGIQYIFQIGSVDEALSIKDREESKQALSVVGRG